MRRIASFGATAIGHHDEWSDVDLIVVCAERDSAWQCSSVIREFLPVVFYRPFTAREQPDGRYWFKGESPMNRLDVSFETGQTFDAILSNSAKDGFKVITHDEYVAAHGIGPGQEDHSMPTCIRSGKKLCACSFAADEAQCPCPNGVICNIGYIRSNIILGVTGRLGLGLYPK